ncbi:hypothetical protein [Salinicola sp. NYA28a]
MARLSIRSAPDDLPTRLDSLAESHHRSREGEMLHALVEYVDRNESVSHQESAALHYQKTLSQRLTGALDQVKSLRGFSEWSAGMIAERNGENDPQAYIAGFAGEGSLSFHQLDAIAETIGVAPAWLKHGTGTPWPTTEVRLQGDLDAKLDQMLQGRHDRPLRALHLLRGDDATGALYLIKEFHDSPAVECFSTPHHVSEDIGAGGEGDLTEVFEWLRKLYSRTSAPAIISYLMPSGLREAWRNGTMHPLKAAERASRSTWWQDVWDPTSLDRGECWEGQHDLTRRIFRATASKNVGRRVPWLVRAEPTAHEQEMCDWWGGLTREDQKHLLDGDNNTGRVEDAWRHHRAQR